LKRRSFILILLILASLRTSNGQTLQFFHDNRQFKISPREHNSIRYYSLRDVSSIFELPFQEKSAEEFLMRGPRGSITFFGDKAEIRVNGEMVALDRPVWRRKGEHWYVTADFFDKALPRIIGVQLTRKSATAFELEAKQPQAAVIDVKAQTAVAPDHARLVLEPSQGVDFQTRDTGRTIEITANRRFRVAVPATPPNQSFMGRITFDPSGSGVLRVEKGPSFQSSREQTLDNPLRKIVDFYGPPAVPPTPPALTPPATVEVPVLPPIQVPPEIAVPPVQSQKFVRRPTKNIIVLDPGHGGADLGAHPSTELLEKVLSLSLAQQVKSVIEAQSFYRVVITRQSDVQLGIIQRTSIANSFHAEALVSLHFGGSYDSGMRGPRVYYYSERSSNAANEKKEPAAEVRRAPALTPWNRAQLSMVSQSQAMAGRLQAKLNELFGTPEIKPGSNQFLVLQGSISPAVILEAGYLSNPDDARFLADSNNMKRVAAAIAIGIVDFLNAKGAAN
jgi:N-acetylmuramoyl-L-alanine amidase